MFIDSYWLDELDRLLFLWLPEAGKLARRYRVVRERRKSMVQKIGKPGKKKRSGGEHDPCSIHIISYTNHSFIATVNE
jgi:hypothetical protein